MVWTWAGVLFFLLRLNQSVAVWPFRASCVLNVDRDLSHQSPPLLLRRGTSGYRLAAPDDVVTHRHRRQGLLKLQRDEEIYVACPGYRNTIQDLKEPAQFATYTCQPFHNTLRMDKQVFKAKRVRCAQPVTPVIRETGQDCGGGLAREYEVGYSVTPESNPSVRNPYTSFGCMRRNNLQIKKAVKEGQTSFHRVLRCCYDRATVRTLYSVHTLHGDKIAGAEAREAEPYYTSGRTVLYPHGFNIHNVYNQPQQETVLRQLLGKTRADSLLSSALLTRGHLAPAEDLLMGTWQASADTYLNLVPQWQSISLGHWYRLEKKIRRLADTSQETLIVATGTFGVLKMTDELNTTRELFLDPERRLLPVPELLWKVIFSPRNYSCIAFLMSNNPVEVSPSQPLCQDVCREHGWPTEYSSPFLGRMYCCSVQNLRQVVDYVPDFRCTSVLNHVPDQKIKRRPSFSFRMSSNDSFVHKIIHQIQSVFHQT